MKIIYSGVSDLAVVRCTNEKKQHYAVVWDCQVVPSEDESDISYSYKCIDYDHKPTIDEVKADIEGYGGGVEDWTPYEEALA